MKILVHWRGRNVLDVEVHVWTRPEEPKPPQGPSLQATGGGEFERGTDWGDPATIGRFGFQR